MTSQPTPTNYAEALAVLSGKLTKRIANNTYLEKGIYTSGAKFDGLQQAISVRLHATNIVTFLEDGTTILDSGGWQTVTTKERLNRYLPKRAGISQRNYQWLYFTPEQFDTYEGVTFVDGMRINSLTGEFVAWGEVVA